MKFTDFENFQLSFYQWWFVLFSESSSGLDDLQNFIVGTGDDDDDDNDSVKGNVVVKTEKPEDTPLGKLKKINNRSQTSSRPMPRPGAWVIICYYNYTGDYRNSHVVICQ